MPELHAASEALEKIVRVALKNNPGDIQLGNVHIRLTEKGLEFDPESVEEWNREGFHLSLEALMRENPEVAALFEQGTFISQLTPFLIDKDDLKALTKEPTHPQSDNYSLLFKEKVIKEKIADRPDLSEDEDARKTMASYTEGGITRKGVRIKKIIGRTKDFIVFIYKHGHTSSVAYEYWPDPPQNKIPAISECNKLSILARCSLGPIHREVTTLHLAFALSSAFHLPSVQNVLEPFEPIESLIKKKSEENARFSYIFWGGLFAILTCLAIICTYYYGLVEPIRFRDVLFGGMAGTVGASVSVIQRGKNLLFEPYAGSFFIAFQGIVRIVLGIIFGVFTVIAIKAGVLTNLVNKNFYLLLAFCIVAGVSERFVPDLIERLENKKHSTDEQ